eukprot:2424686-Amphidinium_carterae.1
MDAGVILKGRVWNRQSLIRSAIGLVGESLIRRLMTVVSRGGLQDRFRQRGVVDVLVMSTLIDVAI